MRHRLDVGTFVKAPLWIGVACLVLSGLPAAADAEQNAVRFCLQALDFEDPLDADAAPLLIDVVETPVPEHDIFFFQVPSLDGARYFAARLIGDTFVRVTGTFPANHVNSSIVVTPDGEVFGSGGPVGSRTLYRMDDATGRFEKMRLDGPEDLDRLRDIAWSTPLDAPILLTGGSTPHPDRGAVFALEGDKAVRVGGLKHWVTHVTDFPDLKLTVMATETTDRIYVIDGNRTLHDLVELDLDGGRFISRTLFPRRPAAASSRGGIQGALPDPHRAKGWRLAALRGSGLVRSDRRRPSAQSRTWPGRQVRIRSGQRPVPLLWREVSQPDRTSARLHAGAVSEVQNPAFRGRIGRSRADRHTGPGGITRSAERIALPDGPHSGTGGTRSPDHPDATLRRDRRAFGRTHLRHHCGRRCSGTRPKRSRPGTVPPAWRHPVSPDARGRAASSERSVFPSPGPDDRRTGRVRVTL